MGISFGSVSRQTGIAWGQRVQNRQPAGGFVGLGISPPSTTRFVCSNETVVIADSSKWGQESFSNISPLELGDYYVTDPGADAATAASIKSLGKQVIFSAVG